MKEKLAQAGLEGDVVPETVNAIVNVFFEEMWPYLSESMEALSRFVESDLHEFGSELPRKTFTATPGFEAFQTGEGALTVPFTLNGIKSRRMVVPYQIWMLQRIAAAMVGCDLTATSGWLATFNRGEEILELDNRMARCRITKQGGLLYSTGSIEDIAIA